MRNVVPIKASVDWSLPPPSGRGRKTKLVPWIILIGKDDAAKVEKTLFRWAKQLGRGHNPDNNCNSLEVSAEDGSIADLTASAVSPVFTLGSHQPVGTPGGACRFAVATPFSTGASA